MHYSSPIIWAAALSWRPGTNIPVLRYSWQKFDLRCSSGMFMVAQNVGPFIHCYYLRLDHLLFTALDFTSITSHIHNWVLFLLWLHLFSLSGVISPLISSSIVGTHWCGGFIFQCPIFLPFHIAHGALKARILKWLAIAFSSGLCFVITLHHDPSILGGPMWHGS